MSLQSDIASRRLAYTDDRCDSLTCLLRAPAHERPGQALVCLPPRWGYPVATEAGTRKAGADTWCLPPRLGHSDRCSSRCSRRAPAHEWPEQALCACSPVGALLSRFALVVCSSIYALLGRGRATMQVRAESIEFVFLAPPGEGASARSVLRRFTPTLLCKPPDAHYSPPSTTAHPPHPVRVW